MFKSTIKTRLSLPKTEEEKEELRVKTFLDMNAPAAVKFFADHFICGSTYRSVWAIREYPTETSEQAILRHMGEKSGVTLRIGVRHVTPNEERKIISNAASKNRMNQANTNDIQQNIMVPGNQTRGYEILMSIPVIERK